jgi:hypothetical protein
VLVVLVVAAATEVVLLVLLALELLPQPAIASAAMIGRQISARRAR